MLLQRTCNTLRHATHCNTLQYHTIAGVCNHTNLPVWVWFSEARYRECVAVCCSVLQCVAVCCSVLQCVAVCCSVLLCVAVCCNVYCVAVCCIVVQCVAVCCNSIACAGFGVMRTGSMLQCAVLCTMLLCAAVSCSTFTQCRSTLILHCMCRFHWGAHGLWSCVWPLLWKITCRYLFSVFLCLCVGRGIFHVLGL